ncbi:SDR family oxidoreductase [Frankia sp. AgPm24]|uniref:SDR family oxidoreductase n=1 Tax=Frankia sp. AgPm24 TaxID=631128 RepID=UPI00200E090C|nr:SDR family oxidoreductase [Frankia sp. AgPm24]MCK9923173.1 SDR family oxidoreductase [Frankia sp. AgPm24]
MILTARSHSIPKALVPTRSFPLAETDPAAFVRVIVRRSKVFGKKLHSGLSYSFSKNFVQWYSRRLAAVFGAKGARVLSVSPGSFDTAMGKLEADPGASDLLKVSAIKRFGEPEEIAAVLAFAASEAPGYLTGIDILVDGGTRAGQEFRSKS